MTRRNNGIASPTIFRFSIYLNHPYIRVSLHSGVYRKAAVGLEGIDHAPDEKFPRDGSGASPPRRQIPPGVALRGDTGAARWQPGGGACRVALVYQRHHRLRKARRCARPVAEEPAAHARRVLEKRNFFKQINLIWVVQSSIKKYSHFPFHPNHLHISCRLVPQEGRLAIVTDAGRDAVDAGSSGANMRSQGGRRACERSSGARTNDVAGGRRSRVVLTPRRWRQVGGRRLLPNRAFGRRVIPPMTVANKPGHRGDHEVNR